MVLVQPGGGTKGGKYFWKTVQDGERDDTGGPGIPDIMQHFRRTGDRGECGGGGK